RDHNIGGRGRQRGQPAERLLFSSALPLRARYLQERGAAAARDRTGPLGGVPLRRQPGPRGRGARAERGRARVVTITERKPSTNKSLAKAVRVLKLFSAQEPRLPLAEISARLDMPKSTTHAILRSLVAEGLIEKIGGEAYALGTGILALSQSVRVNVEV